MSSRRPRGSRPADGSSNTSTPGSIDRTVASATRFRWPRLSRCGHPPLEAGHADGCQRPLDAPVDLGLVDAHVERPERDVLEHRRAEQLVVGVLEDEADHRPDSPDRRAVDHATRRCGPSRGSARGCRSGGAAACSCRRRSARRARPSRPARSAGRGPSAPRSRPGSGSGGARSERRPRGRCGGPVRAAWTWSAPWWPSSWSWAWTCSWTWTSSRTALIAAPARRGPRSWTRHRRPRTGRAAPTPTAHRPAVEMAELALEAARLHRRVDPLAALVRAQEQRPDHRAGDPRSPGDRPARPSRRGRRRARRARPRHPRRLVGEDREVAVHEADDRDHDPRQAQLAERVDEVVERRREREQQRGLDADPALERDRRELLEALAADRQRQRAEDDRRPSGSPGRVKTSGSAASRNGAASSARRAGRNGPRWATVESDDHEPATPAARRTTRRQQADRDDERDRRDELQPARRRGGAGSPSRRSDRGPAVGP